MPTAISARPRVPFACALPRDWLCGLSCACERQFLVHAMCHYCTSTRPLPQVQKTKRFAANLLLRCHYSKFSRSGKKTIFAHPAEAFYSPAVRFLRVKPCNITLMAVCHFVSEEFAHLWQVFLGRGLVCSRPCAPGSDVHARKIYETRAQDVGVGAGCNPQDVAGPETGGIQPQDAVEAQTRTARGCGHCLTKYFVTKTFVRRGRNLPNTRKTKDLRQKWLVPLVRGPL